MDRKSRLGTVHLAHTAFTDLLQDFVVGEGLADQSCYLLRTDSSSGQGYYSIGPRVSHA